MFNKFYKSEGIFRHKIVPHTLQQNDLVKRMKRSLLEILRCMLLKGNVSKNFWGETIKMAVYHVNRCPPSEINFKTPKEMKTNYPPSYENLKVFRCVAYAHLQKGKLDVIVKKYIFIR